MFFFEQELSDHQQLSNTHNFKTVHRLSISSTKVDNLSFFHLIFHVFYPISLIKAINISQNLYILPTTCTETELLCK